MKKIISIILLAIAFTTLSASTCLAVSRWQYCANTDSEKGHDYTEHILHLEHQETYREECTRHENCMVAIKYYREAWRCSKCDYATWGEDYSEETHHPLNRSLIQ